MMNTYFHGSRCAARLFSAAMIGLLVLASAVTARAAARRPNVVFVLIDDLGWRDVGCFGSTFYETPHIDRLAATGMKFTNAYAACPVCSPTRASIMCGKYPARIRLTDFLKGRRKLKGSPILPADYADQMELDEVTIAEVLKSRGYRTCFLGKWHLGGPKYYPQFQGFDINIGGTHHGMPRAYFWPRWKNNPPIIGKFPGENLTDRLSQEACQFIKENASKEQPFFLYLSHYAVHIPIQGKEKKIAHYKAKLSASPPRKGRQNNPYYAAMVETVDDSVGRVLNTLRRLKIDDKTIVIFFSDNGGLATREGRHTPATINAPLRAGKGYLYEGGIREPLIVRWPGVVTPGSVSDEPVVSVDFLPTICEMVGIDFRGVKTNGPVDGISMTPVLKHPAVHLPSRALYWHYPHFSNQGGRPGAAVRLGDWKLIERYEFGNLELYNLKTDPGERNNLAKRFRERAGRMRAMLVNWRQSVHANMPRPNPAYKPNRRPER